MAPATDNLAPNLGTSREVFVLGDRQIAKDITQALVPLNFLLPRPVSDLAGPRPGPHFIIAICNFTDLANMQVVARSFTKLDSPSAHKIIYAIAPAEVDQQHLLFGIEVGSRFCVAGPNRDFHLKEYIKRSFVTSQGTLNFAAIEAEIEVCRTQRDDRGLQRIAEKLLKLPKDHEDVLRLQAITSRYLRLINKSVFYLRRLLTINPQNLWAASELGRMYLRANRIAEGIEVIEKLSQFHDLNSERQLVLGNAYLEIGKTSKAEKSFSSGASMIGTESDDLRFQEGLAKVKVAEGDLQSALAMLGKASLSSDVLAFINMRAILSIKNGQVDDGIRFYRMALQGCRDDRVVQAKLYFNIALAYLRIKQDEAALIALRKSAELGGETFTRSKTTMENLAKMVARKSSSAGPGESGGIVGQGQPSQEFDTLDELELELTE